MTSSMSLLDFSPFDLDQPHMYPTVDLCYQSSKEKAWNKQFSAYVSKTVKTDLNVNSAILHSMAQISHNLSIYDILAMNQTQWVDHCKDLQYDPFMLTGGIHSIKKKYCDHFANFGDRVDLEGNITRKRIPCASWFDSDCADFITDRAISRILNYAWDVPHKSLVFTLDPTGWDLVTWDNINDFCQLVRDVVDLTINQQFKSKHSRIKGHVSAGIIIIPHTFSSLDPTKWQPHFNVLVSCKGVLDNSGNTTDLSYLDYNLLRKNYKELLYNRFGLYRKGNYQIEISNKDRELSDSSFVDILRYNKRAPISDNDIIAIHDTGIEFTNYKRKDLHLPDLMYSFNHFFYGIMQHLPPKNKVQIHRYGLYNQLNKNFKNYPVAFDSSQSTLSEYEGKTWLWTAYSGRVVAYNGSYLLDHVPDMSFFNEADRLELVDLIREDREDKIFNKNPDVCRILTPIVYNLKHPPPDLPGQHKNFGFLQVSV